MRILIFALLSLSLSGAFAAEKTAKAESKKKVSYRKTQEVNFDGADIDGQVRSPDGAYLLQKRGVHFMPLYKVNNQFEQNILDSVEYLR
jgi:ethanolamine utilization protein EutP (predicted NTPase)